MFDRDEFVALLSCLDKGHVQADFEFLGNHVQFLLSLRPGITVYGNGTALFNGFRKTLQRVA